MPHQKAMVCEIYEGRKLRMGIIRNQDFGILALTMAALQITRVLEWEDIEKLDRAGIAEIVAAFF